MAKGRFISKSISQSDQVAALPSDRERLMFTWMIAHCDVRGRLTADPRKLKGVVFTLLDFTSEEIDQALHAMEKLGLIRMYTADDRAYLYFPGWYRHQQLREDREKPECPDPPEGSAENNPAGTAHRQTERGSVSSSFQLATADRGGSALGEDSVATSGELPEVARQLPGNFRENDGASSSSSSSSSPRTSSHWSGAGAPGSHLNFESLIDAYNQHRGVLPKAEKLTKSRKKHLSSLVREVGSDAARALLIDATRFCAADRFWQQQRYNVDNLLQPGRVQEKAEKQRAVSTSDDGGAAIASYREKGL
jgi:hypothetical protein